MRPPRGCASNETVVWKMITPENCLVEPVRLSQPVIEKWFKENEILRIPFLPHLFIKHTKDGRIMLAIAKVVDELHIVGKKRDIMDFFDNISQRFKPVDSFLGELTYSTECPPNIQRISP